MHLLIVANPTLETPQYKVERVRKNDVDNGVKLLHGSGGSISIQVGIGTTGSDSVAVNLGTDTDATALGLTTGVDSATNAATRSQGRSQPTSSW